MPYLTIASNATNANLIDITLNDAYSAEDLYNVYTIRKSQFIGINKDDGNMYLTLLFSNVPHCKELPCRFTPECGREKFCVQATATYDANYSFAFRVDSVEGVAVTDNSDLKTKLLPLLA